MDANSFMWWIHGWSEINGGAAPSSTQWQIMVDHLELTLGESITAARAPESLARPAGLDLSHAIICPCGRGPSCQTNARLSVRDRAIFCGGILLGVPGPSGKLVANPTGAAPEGYRSIDAFPPPALDETKVARTRCGVETYTRGPTPWEAEWIANAKTFLTGTHPSPWIMPNGHLSGYDPRTDLYFYGDGRVDSGYGGDPTITPMIPCTGADGQVITLSGVSPLRLAELLYRVC